jgi:hypothetical protein
MSHIRRRESEIEETIGRRGNLWKRTKKMKTGFLHFLVWKP